VRARSAAAAQLLMLRALIHPDNNYVNPYLDAEANLHNIFKLVYPTKQRVRRSDESDMMDSDDHELARALSIK